MTAVTAFGVVIGIRTNSAQVVPLLHERLPPGSQLTSASPSRIYTLNVINSSGVCRRSQRSRKVLRKSVEIQGSANHKEYELRVGQVCMLSTSNLTEALEVLESDLQLHVAEMSEQRLFVHAGVVGWRGRAILVPGLSGSGKTTLIASLLTAGATYYSDEFAVIDPDGHVHPYPTPLRIHAAQENSRIRCWPEALGSTRGVESLPVGLILITPYRAGSRWQPRVLSPGRALLALIGNTVSIQRQPQFALVTLRRTLSNSVALESCRGEAFEIAQILLKEMDRGVPG